MFTLPAIPTDSIYKFMFVSGLVLMIFSMYNIHQQTVLLSSSLSEAKSFSDQQEIISSLDSLKVADLEMPHVKEIFTREELKHKLGELHDDIILQKSAIVKSRQKMKQRDEMQKRLDQDLIIFVVIAICGLIMIVFGGIGWSIYVQRPQDKLLALQVQLAEIELQKAGQTPIYKQVQPQVSSKLNKYKLFK